MEDTSLPRSLPLALLTLLLVTLFSTCAAQGDDPRRIGARAQTSAPSSTAPDRELRAVWMASVLNIDYPSSPTPSAATLQADFRSQLYRLRQAGINTLYVQVRPAGDALYPSALAPWSEYLTGRQGKAPTDGFDPLAYIIETAHARGVEVHAWVNPYRVAMNTDSVARHPKHLLSTHPEWIHTYGGRQYLDPGLPAVRAHLGKVIDELVANYDLDGVHFDDYFYPYPKAGEDFPDSLTFRQYGGSMARDYWRRENVNTFVAETHRRIKAAKPWVQFGVSPFGVWRNRAQDPARGSDTRAGATSYDDLHADALQWARAGTVDYLAPQLYWSMDYPAASHRTLANWWAQNTPATVNLYFGHAAYKVRDNADAAWNDLQEIPHQIAYTRQLPAVGGSAFFSARSIFNSRNGLAPELAKVYARPALHPERLAPTPVVGVRVKTFKPKATEEGQLIIWEVDKKLPEENLPHYYAIYRGPKGEAAEMIHRTPFGLNCRRLHYYDKATTGKTKLLYRVVPMDRYHRPLVDLVAR